MGLLIRKLLDVYFEKWELQNILDSIHEPVSGNKDELIERIIEEWPRHRKNYYDFLKKLDKSRLSNICKAYGLNSKGNKNALIKIIRKENLLVLSSEDTKKIGKANYVKALKSTESLIGRKEILFILITLVITFGGGTFFFIMENPEFLNELLKKDVIDGKTYKSYSLGFQIDRPNVMDWEFVKDLEFFREKTGMSPQNEKVLGGVIVGSKTKGSVTVGVQKIVDPNVDNVEMLKDKEYISMIKTYSPLLIHNNTSVVEDSAWIEMVGWLGSNSVYIYQKFEENNDRLYIIQVGYTSIEEVPEEIKQELKGIANSFSYLP